MCILKDAMTKALSELLALVKQLRDEVGQQRNEIAYLRQLIENCAGCQHRAEPLKETCELNNPCFPGEFTHFFPSPLLYFFTPPYPTPGAREKIG